MRTEHGVQLAELYAEALEVQEYIAGKESILGYYASGISPVEWAAFDEIRQLRLDGREPEEQALLEKTLWALTKAEAGQYENLYAEGLYVFMQLNNSELDALYAYKPPQDEDYAAYLAELYLHSRDLMGCLGSNEEVNNFSRDLSRSDRAALSYAWHVQNLKNPAEKKQELDAVLSGLRSSFYGDTQRESEAIYIFLQMPREKLQALHGDLGVDI